MSPEEYTKQVRELEDMGLSRSDAQGVIDANELFKAGIFKLKKGENIHLQMVLDYILEHELEDFDENPSSNHVYFHAFALRFGGLSADAMLRESL